MRKRPGHLLANFAASALIAVSLTAAWSPLKAADQAQTEALQTETKVYNLCLEADRLIARSEFEKAITVLKTAASHDRTSYSPYVHTALARCYRGTKNFDQAIAESKEALKFDPKAENAVYTMALVYSDMNRLDDSLNSLKQFVKITNNPDLKRAAQDFISKQSAFKSMQAATKCIESGKDKEALKLLNSTELSESSQYAAQVHAARSFVYRRLGDSEKAIEEGKKVIEADPQNKAIAYNIAIAYQDVAKFDEAIIWLKKYAQIETDPTRRSAAETFMHELEVDRKQLNAEDNKLPDYLEQMRRKKDVPTWPKQKMPLKVYIAPGSGVRGYQSAFRSYAIKAFDTWCAASGKKLNYTLEKNPIKADISVTWSADKLVGNDQSDDRLKAGLTTLTSERGAIENATVRIRTTDPFNPEINVKNGECAFTCMHEIGHALGLGHSTYIYDIMYFRSSTKQTGLPTKRDNATIAKMYVDHPAVAFVAKVEGDAGGPVKYLPPPVFVPPGLAESAKKITPPLFIPPPLVPERKLTPPMFTPPPLSESERPARSPKTAPLFTPPPLVKKKESRPAGPQLFVPPPIKH